MKTIQDAVRAYLQSKSGITAVCDRTQARGIYPLLTVTAQEQGTVLISGGTQAEHRYLVRITAADSRGREENPALLSSLVPLLLQGIPMEHSGTSRVLHPLDIRTGEESLTFSLELCVPVSSAAGSGTETAEVMDRLHFRI